MATIDLGKIKMVWRGAYNNATAYTPDDVVSSGGSSYICILASTGNAVSNATYWSLLAQGGTDVGATLTTQGDLLYRDGSGLQRLAKPGSTMYLQMTSGGVPSWSALSSDFVKLAGVNATGSASSITIDNVFTSDYDIYKIYYTRMNPASGIDHTQFRMRLLDASGSEITSSNYLSGWMYHYFNSGTDTTSSEKQWGVDYVKMHRDHIGQRTDNYKSHDMEMTLYNPLSTSWKTSWKWNANADDGGGTSEYTNIGWGFINASPIANRGIKFYTYDGDNIDADARVSCYGIKN